MQRDYRLGQHGWFFFSSQFTEISLLVRKYSSEINDYFNDQQKISPPFCFWTHLNSLNSLTLEHQLVLTKSIGYLEKVLELQRTLNDKLKTPTTSTGWLFRGTPAPPWHLNYCFLVLFDIIITTMNFASYWFHFHGLVPHLYILGHQHCKCYIFYFFDSLGEVFSLVSSAESTRPFTISKVGHQHHKCWFYFCPKNRIGLSGERPKNENKLPQFHNSTE